MILDFLLNYYFGCVEICILSDFDDDCVAEVTLFSGTAISVPDDLLSREVIEFFVSDVYVGTLVVIVKSNFEV